MNSTIRAVSTSTRSTGMPENDCIRLPPARSAPNSSAASRTPHGLPRPSSATVMPSKPMLPATEPVNAPAVPSSTVVPPRPASAPAMIIVPVYETATLIPAVRAASGLRPTARSSKPNVERLSNHATATTAATLSRMPRCTRRSPPASFGSRPVESTGLLIASLRLGSCTPFCTISQDRKYRAM